jgi:predicted enzyme related to lactoylglutathione lyase
MKRVVHFEIHADDLERAKKFYSTVFGWEMQQMGSEYGNYVVVVTGPGPDEIAKGSVTMENLGINGGMMLRKGPRPAPGAPVNGYTCIIGVKDIDETIAKIEAAGGVLALAKMDVPNVGLLAYYHDTEGNIFGVIQPAMPKK